MALAFGTRLGPYEIIAPIGAGGMGEVYRAKDTRLDRTVAVKVLPSEVQADSDRRARFEREARAVAALSHPNILAIHDVGTHDGHMFVVTELLDGTTLRERLRETPPVRAVVEIAAQIARGLAAAHDRGIAHRDLKPENIFVLGDGQVKILDFGLARRVPAASGASETAAALTDPGLVVGTVGYMAPEQARGLPADHRADIFSLGAVVYEMLAGRRAFAGDTALDTLTAIVRESPPPLASTPERPLPPLLVRIVDRCLEKSPAARFQSATDLAFALAGLSSVDTAETATLHGGTGGTPFQRRRRLAWIAAAVAAVLVPAAWYLAVADRAVRQPDRPVRFDITVPALSVVSGVTVSPNGFEIVLGLRAPDGRTRLWRRPLAGELKVVAGTDGARFPFWSPNGRFLAFFAGGKLRVMEWPDGAPIAVADAPNGRGGTWNDDGIIVFSPEAGTPLYQVPAAGGPSTPVTELDGSLAERSHRFPHFLPDGRRFSYLALAGQSAGDSGLETHALYVGSLDGSPRERLLLAQTSAHVSAGFLVFTRDDVLLAQPFDGVRAAGAGEPMTVAAPVGYAEVTGQGAFSASANGVLVYRTEQTVATQLEWFGRDGRSLGTLGTAGAYAEPALSPDATRLALEVTDPETREVRIWIVDAQSGSGSPFTHDAARFPAWSPDGRRIAYSARNSVVVQEADGGRETTLVPPATFRLRAPSWAPDMKRVIYSTWDGRTDWDVWAVSPSGDSDPVLLVEAPARQTGARVSPDGRWLAYVSNERNGTDEIFVQSYPEAAGRWQVSTAGGSAPRWRGDSRELFYLGGDGQLMAVAVSPARSFQGTPARPLFRLPASAAWAPMQGYDVTSDGARFVFARPTDDVALARVTVLINWPATIGRTGR